MSDWTLGDPDERIQRTEERLLNYQGMRSKDLPLGNPHYGKRQNHAPWPVTNYRHNTDAALRKKVGTVDTKVDRAARIGKVITTLLPQNDYIPAVSVASQEQLEILRRATGVTYNERLDKRLFG